AHRAGLAAADADCRRSAPLAGMVLCRPGPADAGVSTGRDSGTGGEIGITCESEALARARQAYLALASASGLRLSLDFRIHPRWQWLPIQTRDQVPGANL